MSVARKGDIVAVKIEHSYQSLASGRHAYETWHLASVESASRDGAVKAFRLSEEQHARRLEREPATVEVLTLPPERSVAARRVFDVAKAFSSGDELRIAILEAEATP